MSKSYPKLVRIVFSSTAVGFIVLNGPVALADEVEERTVFELPSIRVYGLTSNAPTIYSSEMIDLKASTNRDISSLLSDHPAVRFDSSSYSSLNRGSMDVDEVSFHGSNPYQNLFTIDGFNATNNIDPAEKNGNLKPSSIPSNSQAFFLDTSLLESVAVYDKNIPIEFGSFTGGVVDARIKRAGPENKFKLSYGWSGSNLTRQKIDEGHERAFGLGNPGNSPSWRKKEYALAGEVRINERLGLTLSGSHRESDIERYHVIEHEGRNQQEKSSFKDEVDNILAKLSYAYRPNSVMDFTLKYSDRSESLVSSVLRNTAWDNKHRARGLAFNWEHGFNNGSRFQFRAGWDYMGSEQRSPSNSLITYNYPGLPNYTTGGYGRNEKSKNVYTIGTRYDFAPFKVGDLINTTYIGADMQYTDFRFKRYQDSYSEIRRFNNAGGFIQTNQTLNAQGEVKKSYITSALYLNNHTEWNNWYLNLGARIDHDDLFHNTNISPRANLSWDMFGNGETLLSVGRSRYYGHSILNMALQQEINSLSYLVRDRRGSLAPDRPSKAIQYKGLKSPYDDEWAISLQKRFAGFLGELSYVHRQGRRQITRKEEGNLISYANEGRSKNDNVSLSIRQIEPWQLGKSYWSTGLSFAWQKTKRSTDYNAGYNSSAWEDEDVYFNGTRIARRDLPVARFYQPRQLALNLNATVPDYGLTWTNTFRWRSGKNDIVYVGRKNRLANYETARLGSYWIWDTKLQWKPAIAKGVEFSAEVLNVLNKMPPLVASNPNLRQSRVEYRTGREFRFQVSYAY